jgi:hypothetical protein
MLLSLAVEARKTQKYTDFGWRPEENDNGHTAGLDIVSFS